MSYPFLPWKQGWFAIFTEEGFTVMHERIVVIWFTLRINVLNFHEVISSTYKKMDNMMLRISIFSIW